MPTPSLCKKENVMDGLTKIKELITPLFLQDDLQLYDISWHQEGKNRILQIAIMRKDGSMDIDTCAAMSEKIGALLDEADLIASEYFLEVCSPGAERELKNEEQIRDAMNEFVFIKFANPKAGMDSVKGYLRAFEDDQLVVEYMDKAQKRKVNVELSNIALIRLSVKI